MTASTDPRIGPVPRVAASGTERAQILADAAAMIAHLQDHPGIPVWSHGIQITWGERDHAGAERVAALLGAKADTTTSAHKAVRRFGKCAYVVIAPNLGEAQ